MKHRLSVENKLTSKLKFLNPHQYAEYIDVLKKENKLYEPDGSINPAAFKFGVIFANPDRVVLGEAEEMMKFAMQKVISGEYNYTEADSFLRVFPKEVVEYF